MSDHEHKPRNYVKIWSILLVLLVISILGPTLEIQVVTLITAFGIAIVKAYLVAKNFMHLDVEKPVVHYLLAVALAFMVLMFSGVAPDVMNHEGTGWTNVAAKAAVRGEAYPLVKKDPGAQWYKDTVTNFNFYPPTPPSDNGLTEAKIALGGRLYGEKRIAKDGKASCSSCHSLENYGQDGVATAGKRNTPSTFNAFRQYKLFWDYRTDTVESLPSEHGLKGEADVVATLAGIEEYASEFKAAFPGESDPITPKNVGLALGAFQRTLVTKSRWDEFLDGNPEALSKAEQKGLRTFVTAGCMACHAGRLLGGHTQQKLGLIKPYESTDLGRYEVTKNDIDKLMFKIPSLSNVEKTAPYYHDGSISSLKEVVLLMAEFQTAVPMTEEQADEIVTFLKSLTGELKKD